MLYSTAIANDLEDFIEPDFIKPDFIKPDFIKPE